MILWSRYYFYLHFTNVETRSQRIRKSFQVIQLVDGKISTYTLICLILKCILLTPTRLSLPWEAGKTRLSVLLPPQGCAEWVPWALVASGLANKAKGARNSTRKWSGCRFCLEETWSLCCDCFLKSFYFPWVNFL